MVGPHVALPQELLKLCGVGRLQGQKASDRRYLDGSISGNDAMVGVERIERLGQEPDLVLADFPEEVGTECSFFEEGEHIGGPVVTGGIVGGAGKSRVTLAVGHLGVSLRGRQVGELGKPSSHRRAQGASLREPQEAVALPQLAVLVPAADHIGIEQVVLHHRKGHHVQGVVGVDQQRYPAVPAGGT